MKEGKFGDVPFVLGTERLGGRRETRGSLAKHLADDEDAADPVAGLEGGDSGRIVVNGPVSVRASAMPPDVPKVERLMPVVMGNPRASATAIA